MADDAQLMMSATQYWSGPFDVPETRKMKEYYFAGPHFISGLEAREMGAVNQAVPAANLREYTEAFAQQVARQDPVQLRLIKNAAVNVLDQQGFLSHVRSWLAQWVVEVLGRPPREDKFYRAREARETAETLGRMQELLRPQASL